MEKMLSKLLESDLLSDETKKEISETFRAVLEDAKTEQNKALRAEFAERYERDKEKIAEAVESYINEKMEREIQEFHGDLKGLAEQRMKYVNAQQALREQAQNAIRHRLAIFEKALRKALVRETKELHEDLKVNRQAALRAITEAKAGGEADRQAFRAKGAKVLEHIINVKLDAQMRALKEDIEKAKQNDFGSRIFEAFMGEARRIFFNSHKELRSMLKKINEQEQMHKQEKTNLLNKIGEVTTIAKKAVQENRQIRESATRSKKMGELLTTIPSGIAREKMKTLLESSPVPDMEKTFRKFAPSILTEVKKPSRTQFTEHAIGTRYGNGRQPGMGDDQDDQEIVQLRQLAGIVRK